MAPRLFCFGLGYSALHLTRLVQRDGWQAAGTARRPEHLASLTRERVAAFRFDDREQPGADALAGATHLLLSIPPQPDGDPVLARCRALLEAIGTLRWIGYLSTTGVYGDHGGGWVDENTPTRPTAERTQRRVDAERRWLDFGVAQGICTQVFRLAGIYGPGRSVIEDILAGTAQRIVRPGQYFSRIHVADIAQCLRAAMQSGGESGIFNLCDDEPAAPSDVIAYACALLGKPVPPAIPFEQANLSPMAASFWADNKRVSNRRLKEVLGVTLLFPTFREGLTAITNSSADF